MASYPTSVKTFTSKSDGAGNRIFASHINDIQDEVTAIEDGLLNGTAPVNSSRVTAASLSVAGNSTIAGALQVNGNLASSAGLSAATLNISGNSSVGGNIVGAQALLIGGQKSTVLSTGDTHNIDVTNVHFVYFQTNSSGSTITGLAGIGTGQMVAIFNAGPSAVLGLKRSTGSASTNQLEIPSDTSVPVGGGASFVYSGLVGRWVRIG